MLILWLSLTKKISIPNSIFCQNNENNFSKHFFMNFKNVLSLWPIFYIAKMKTLFILTKKMLFL